MEVEIAAGSKNVAAATGSRDAFEVAGDPPKLKLTRVLVPVDFSHCSRKALDYAIAFAKSFRAEIILLNVPETPPVPPHEFIVETGDLQTELHKQAFSQLAEWREQIPAGISAKAVTRASFAADQEIVNLARENDVDLIVMGTHGRKGVAHLLIGSTAERVVRNAPCPVLVVRLREHDFVSQESAAAEIVRRTSGKVASARIQVSTERKSVMKKRRTTLKRASRTSAPRSKRRWSAKVMRRSDALDLEAGVFRLRSPKQIALSLKRCAERSKRRKAGPFQSAMSMLNFYINRGGKNMPASRKRVLEKAKVELRKAFGRKG